MSSLEKAANPTGGETLAAIIATHAASRPDHIAFIAGQRRLNWRDYHERSDALAALLLDLGFMAGERIAILLPDDIETHIAFVACEKAGLVATALSPRAGEKEILHLVAMAGATALISAATQGALDMRAIYARLRASGRTLKHHVIIEETPRPLDRISVDGVPTGFDPIPLETLRVLQERRCSPDALFLLNSTSGTTGMPKLVAHQQSRWLAWAALVQKGCAPNENDRFLRAVPASVGFGLWSGHFIPAMLGAPTILMPRFTTSALFAAIAHHRVSMLCLVSTQIQMMLSSPDLADSDLTSLRIVYTGGEAVPRHAVERLEVLTGAKVLQFYGSNEAGAVSHTTLSDPTERRLNSAGRIIPEMRVRLLDASGNDRHPPGDGQPLCNGPFMGLGYFNNPEANAGLFMPDGSMRMEDIVSIDDDGYLRVIGRVGDFIIRGGKNISAVGVEAAAIGHPAIREAAAVAMPDPIFGEKICLFASLNAGLAAPDVATLAAFLRGNGVSPEYFPERLVILDQLPINSGGKIAKSILRDMIAS